MKLIEGSLKLLEDSWRFLKLLEGILKPPEVFGSFLERSPEEFNGNPGRETLLIKFRLLSEPLGDGNQRRRRYSCSGVAAFCLSCIGAVCLSGVAAFVLAALPLFGLAALPLLS